MLDNIETIINREHVDNNECWICCESVQSWHVWKPCNHVYCSKCSEQMLEKKMPCPLCRVVPSSVDNYMGDYCSL